MYIKSTDPSYVQLANYFIYKNKASNLESWIEEYRNPSSKDVSNKFNNIM